MDKYLEIIHHPLTNVVLNIMVALLTLIMSLSFWKKRKKYENSSSWYNFGPGPLGGSRYKSTPQAVWADTLFVWFIVAALSFWMTTSTFWTNAQLLLLSAAMNISIIILLSDDNDISKNSTLEKSKLYVIIFSILFTISVFFHYSSTAVNIWYAGIIIYTAFIHFTRDYYFFENKLIGFALLMVAISFIIKTFPSIIPDNIEKVHPSYLFCAELQLIALLIIKRQAMKIQRVRGFI